MLSANASLYMVLAALVVAFAFVMRRSMAAQLKSRRDTDLTRLGPTRFASIENIDAKAAALHALIEEANGQSQRLESAIARAKSIALGEPRDTLARIEQLADAAALADASALAEAAATIPSIDWQTAAATFQENESTLALTRLADAGLAASEIAARLGLPIGEVELRLNLRSASL
jgi:hypothetical protein